MYDPSYINVDEENIKTATEEVIEQEKINRKTGLRLLLVCFVLMVGGSAGYYFWPATKGLMINKVELSAIACNDRNRSAIISGQVVHEGDTIKGVKVVRIHKKKVDFSRGDKMWSQQLPGIANEKGAEIPNPVFMQFGTPSGPVCRKMSPELVKLNKKYGEMFEIKYVNVAERKEVAAEYQIEELPVQIFFDDSGKELYRHTGYLSGDDIVAQWKELGVLY